MSHQDAVKDALREQAAQVEGHPVQLADVQERARGIRRRRLATSAVAAAAVVTAAVPVGLVIADGLGSESDPGPAASPAPPEADLPDEPVQLLLTTQVEAGGQQPQVVYLQGQQILGDLPSPVELPRDYDTLAPLGSHWVALGNEADLSGRVVELLDGDGTVLTSTPATDSLAVSRDGTVVAYGTPEGDVMALTEGADPVRLTKADDRFVFPSPVGMSPECTASAGGLAADCTVYVTSERDFDAVEAPEVAVGTDGSTSTVAELLRVAGVAPDGSVSGMVSVSDSGSCSAIVDPDGAEVWRTCDYTLGQFSPDGRFVLGHPAYRDGIGDGTLAILDAATGDLLVDATNDRDSQSFLNNAVWDADSTVLATVYEADAWHLLRLTPSGDLRTLTPEGLPEGGDPLAPPLHFAVQP